MPVCAGAGAHLGNSRQSTRCVPVNLHRMVPVCCAAGSRFMCFCTMPASSIPSWLAVDKLGAQRTCTGCPCALLGLQSGSVVGPLVGCSTSMAGGRAAWGRDGSCGSGWGAAAGDGTICKQRGMHRSGQEGRK